MRCIHASNHLTFVKTVLWPAWAIRSLEIVKKAEIYLRGDDTPFNHGTTRSKVPLPGSECGRRDGGHRPLLRSQEPIVVPDVAGTFKEAIYALEK
jgi:hypothetical protein